MSEIEPWLERILDVDERLAHWHRAIDQEWERLKKEHNAKTGSPYGFTAHIEEMGRQAVANVKDDPKPETFAFLVELADAFLKLPPDERSALSDFFADCRHMERTHRGYISSHSAHHLRETRDTAWLRRGLAVAALAQGGTDFRDLHVALADLWDAAKQAGHDPIQAFAEVGSLASTKPGRGGVKSIQEFLTSYRP